MPADQRSWVMLVAQAGVGSFVEWLRSRRRRPAADQRGLRRRAAGAGPLDQPPADRRADQGHHRGGRGAGGALRRAGRGEGAARGDAALLPGDRLRRRPGLRAGGRDRAAPGTPGCRRCWSTRCCAATRRRAGQPGGRAGLGGDDRRSRWRSGRPRPARPQRPARGAPGRPARRGRGARRGARRPAGGGARRGRRPARRDRGRCCPSSATARSWSGRRWPTWTRRPSRPGRRWPASGRPPAWPGAPRPVPAADLLPERALAGDAEARRTLSTTSTAAGRGRRRAAGDR